MINPKPVLFLMLLWISVLVLLQGCAAPGFLVGSGATATTASGSYQTYKTVTIVKAGVYTSMAGKDCKATRVIEAETLTVYCVETKPDFLTKKTKGE